MNAEMFDKELEEVEQRRNLILRDSHVDRLPQLTHIPEDQQTDAFRQVLEELNEDEEAWQTAVQSEEDQETRARFPVKHAGLVGLAFSGGGIRSATLNLGVLQGLKRIGLFKAVDYLSTVSGGGYLGGCISSILATADKDDLPFEHKQGKPEGAVFRTLRNNSNYLAPKGGLDYLRIPLLLMRGILINFAVIMPYILMAAAFTLLFYHNGSFLESSFIPQLPVPFSLSLIVLAVLVVFGMLLYPLFNVLFRSGKGFAGKAWELRNRSSRWMSLFFLAALVSALLEAQPYFLNLISDGLLEDIQILSGSAGLLSLVGGVFGRSVIHRLWKWLQAAMMSLIALLGILTFWGIYIWLTYRAAQNLESNASGWDSPWFLYYILIAFGLWLYTTLTVDINQTSMHNFYRDRLSKAYLFKPNTDDPELLDHNDTLKLSELNQNGRAPYHLINTAVSVEDFDDPYKRGRHADFFLFSKHYVGSWFTGYCPTEEMEKADPHMNLGTAVAVSGAAAAPNMGRFTSRPLRFILSMLNIRLNYWLPNPKGIERRLGFGRNMRRVGPLYLIREMFGGLSENSWNVNVSDGGHIENLGIYELLRRQCRLIICGDGEADSGFCFDGLATVIRMAQIDLGIKITMEGLDEIRNGEQSYAIGTIHYGTEETPRRGKLIYLKSSMPGDHTLESTLTPEAFVSSPNRDDNRHFDDNPYLANYEMEEPTFPHQSTGDQFFDEKQFECYRALGAKIALETFWR
ncbi:MAG: hypothetical protein QNK37_12255 [Acidobacteriota bacterium]|nr:hypothetical protein [Acidobacteriota bacterium]